MPSERTPPAERSAIAKPLEWLTTVVVQFPKLTLLLAGAGVAFSLWLTMTQLGFRTSRSELLDPQSDYSRRWLEYTKEFGEKEDVVVVVEGDNQRQITPALDDVCRRLSERPDLFGAVLHQADAPRLRSKGLYYLKHEELQQIDGFLDQAGPILQGNWSPLNLGGMAQWMGAAMSDGSPQRRQQMMAAMQHELPRVMHGLTAALGQSGSYKSPWPAMSFSSPLEVDTTTTRLISEDGRMGFVLLRFLEEDRQSFAQNNQSITTLRQLTADVQGQHPGTKIGLTGLPIIEYDEMRSSETSMSYATILSFAGVLAVMIVAFGGFRHAALALAALMVGTIWTCGYIALTIGYINVLSIAFASILFGMGIDYGIYYVTRYLQMRTRTDSTSEALVRTSGLVGPGILTGACTSAIAFLAAGFTEFPGVAQLGLIAGSGVLLCWLAQTMVLPAMIRLTDADGVREHESLPAPLNLRFWLSPMFAYPRFTLAVGGLFLLVTAAGMPYLRYDYNLLNLQPVGLECVELEHKLFNQTNRSAWFALSMARTPEEVQARKEAFLKLPSVERVVEVATKLPSDLDPKRPIIERIHQRLANLPREAPAIPVTPLAELERMLGSAQAMLASQPGAAEAAAGLQQVRDMLQRIPASEYVERVRHYQQMMATDLLSRLQMLAGASMPEPPCVSDLPESVAARFVGKSGCYLMHVYSKANIWEVGPMGQFVHDVRSVDPEATGNPLQVYEASRQMKRSFEQAAWYALLVIAPLVLVGFRRLSHSLLAALPMGIGLLETLGLMGLLDIPLNPANMIVLPLTLGLGMDTGINLIYEMRCHRGRYRGAGNSVIVAVVVNTLTTMVGFGALMVANHQGLQSLGRVLTISMGFNMLNSLLLPNLLVVGGFACRGQADADDACDEDETADEADEDLDYEADSFVEAPSISFAA
jgi:hopanoid biosynthesis associated RND transporter like protein HpnN